MIHRLLQDYTPESRRPVSSVRGEAALAAAPVAPACLNPAEALHGQSALLQRLASPWATLSVLTQDPLPGLDFSAEILERITVNLVLNAAEALRGENHGRHGARRPQMLGPSGTQASSDSSADSAADASATRTGENARAGRIRVSMRMVDGRLRLSVEDNGPGMPPAIAAAFLKPAPLPPGTARGLGHRIVHELAQATGGQISIRVRPGAGTTLSLDWPVKMAAAHCPDGPTLRLVPSQRASASRGARSAWSRSHQGGPEIC
jgi:signal transduction histidine kinase